MHGDFFGYHVSIVIVLFGFFLGCFTLPLWEYAYEGDGTFKDFGPRSPSQRYTLDLGPTDFSRVGKHIFNIGDLPKERFALGFVGHLSKPGLKNLIVRVRLVDRDTKNAVFDFSGSIADWTWSTKIGDPSTPFIYYVGETERDDGGRGTLFYPLRGHRYVLTVEVLQAADVSTRAFVHLRGGGWM